MTTTFRQPVRIADTEINELNVFYVEGDILDERGLPVPLVSVATFTIRIYDDLTGMVINSRDDQSVLNLNGGTYHATNGHFTFNSETDDCPIVGAWARGRRESHTALFVVTWGSSGYWSGEVKLRVANLGHVGSP